MVLAFLRNYGPIRNIYRNRYSFSTRLAPAGTIVMPRRSRYKSHHRSVAGVSPFIRVGRTDARRGHKSGTILANETVHLPGIVERRRGMTGSGWTAGMHRNCAHCLMRARRLRIGAGSANLVPLLRFGRTATTHRRERKRASMIYRLSSRDARTAIFHRFIFHDG